MSTKDISAPEARGQRDALASRTDVLDKVGALRTLPDDVHVTTPMVAEFYEVDAELIRYHVKANRDELDSDGYRVIGRGDFEREFGSLSNLDPKVRSVALFPRRAVLRIGMLLRDSAVARQVRDYLVDVEADARPAAVELTDDELIHRALEVSARRIAALAEKVAELEPKAEVADKFLDADGDLSVRDAAQALTRAGVKVGQNRLFGHLDRQCHWISRSVDGRYRVLQTAIESGYMSVLPQSHYHPRTGVLVLDAPQPRVTPKGLQRLLRELGGAQ